MKTNSALRDLELRALAGADVIWTTPEKIAQLPEGVRAQILQKGGRRPGQAIAVIHCVPIKIIELYREI